MSSAPVHSSALRDFKDALGMVEDVVTLETKTYSSPPKQSEQAIVRSLRAAATVLMVASFEYFLKQSIEEHLARLTIQPLAVPFEKLPERMRVTSVYGSLERAMKGPPHEEPPPKLDRLTSIDRACRTVLAGTINPLAFGSTGGNPSAKIVHLLFAELGIADVFARIKPGFGKKWKRPEAHTFLRDKLDEIVHQRHRVAHTAYAALDFTRQQLRDALRFLRIVSELLDHELHTHVATIIRDGKT